jgi:hypothetical protein
MAKRLTIKKRKRKTRKRYVLDFNLLLEGKKKPRRRKRK